MKKPKTYFDRLMQNKKIRKMFEEEARFWEIHNSLDYPEEFTDVKESFEFSPVLLKERVLEENKPRPW
ncbi:MAG TPA: hypothetical protein ENI31_00610 [Candidatus Omnitrophica bacterium]|nr:MAG: hypothetical protein DRP61_04955 [Candidatus Omnitrophota bacterium]RKY34896.1 MAG: hypothetical protein DRP69_03410 [Candidatus Omnitrophota bacterium]RKY42074.1 MAG: hypothetical protein DRP80_07165 [Candidatus Omnitrophota bacterium]HEC68780.1 hypothetical protein [Candidatus Omnitrophota bacterium]